MIATRRARLASPGALMSLAALATFMLAGCGERGRPGEARAATPQAGPATQGAAMYAVIRRYNVQGGQNKDELFRDIQEGFVPLIRKIPGFVAYYGLDAGDRLAFVSVFETKEGAEESTRRAREYVKQRPALRRALSAPEITAGEVKVHAAAERAGAPR